MSNRAGKLIKLLDRYLGIPLIAALGIFHLKRDKPKQIRSVGIFKEAALGDTVLLTGLFEEFKEQHPDTKMIFFCGDSNYVLVKELSFIDEQVKLPIKNPLKSLGIIRKHPVDIMFDFGSWPRINAFLSGLSHSKYVVGFNTSGQYRHFLYDANCSHNSQTHEFENYCRLIKSAGFSVSRMPVLRPMVKLPIALKTKKYVCFHISPGGYRAELREWSISNWKKLAIYLNGKGYTIVVTGALSDFEKNEALRVQSVDMFNIAGGVSFPETITILANAKFVVSVNTGIMHISASLGTPTIGLCGPTSAARWGPIGSNVVAVTPESEGCGFLNLGFEYVGQRTDCMEHITVEIVQEKLKLLCFNK